MSEDVIVVISTYNGEKTIVRQLESIFAQKGVYAKVIIRDDGSSDNTLDVVERYRKASGNSIRIIKGENEGYAKSFWDALREAPKAAYYAFSDQDDVWDENKLIKCIQVMRNQNDNAPKLSYCRMTRTDEQLVPCKEQVHVLTPNELSKKLVLTQTFNYGAATVINYFAKELVTKHFPQSGMVPHDAWMGLLCYWFGKVYYVDESLYYWIRYDSSVTGEGTRFSGIRFRINETMRGKTYMNVAADLLDYYNEYLTESDLKFLTIMNEYRRSFVKKMALLFDFSFRRTTLQGSLMLKFGILMNRF